MSAIPKNPKKASHLTVVDDVSVVYSVVGDGTKYTGTTPPTVTANSDPIASRADGALWDVTAGAYVSIQNTSCGTTTCLKAGQ